MTYITHEQCFQCFEALVKSPCVIGWMTAGFKSTIGYDHHAYRRSQEMKEKNYSQKKKMTMIITWNIELATGILPVCSNNEITSWGPTNYEFAQKKRTCRRKNSIETIIKT